MKTNEPLKVAILTGCASGIGAHLAQAFVREGYRVVCTDIRFREMELLVEAQGWTDGQVMIRTLDVRDAGAWEALMQEVSELWGRVDIVLNNAGYLKPGRLLDMGLEELSLHIDINFHGVVLGTRAAAQVMVKQGFGHIINIGSLASLAPVPGLSMYSASKFAVRGFSLAVAQELRPHGVYVSVVLPDAVATPMLDLQVDYEEAALTFSGAAPLTVDDIEQVVLRRVLPRRPLEVLLPSGRGTLAKIATCAPELSMRLTPLLSKKGRLAQKKIKQEGEQNSS